MKLDIVIDRNAEAPLYRQIYQQIVLAISLGTLVPNDRLPTLNSLGKSLGINLHTVRQAYQMLSDDGIIISRQGKGTFVSKNTKLAKQQVKAKINDFIDEIKRGGLDSGSAQKMKKFFNTMMSSTHK